MVIEQTVDYTAWLNDRDSNGTLRWERLPILPVPPPLEHARLVVDSGSGTNMTYNFSWTPPGTITDELPVTTIFVIEAPVGWRVVAHNRFSRCDVGSSLVRPTRGSAVRVAMSLSAQHGDVPITVVTREVDEDEAQED